MLDIFASEQKPKKKKKKFINNICMQIQELKLELALLIEHLLTNHLISYTLHCNGFYLRLTLI